VFRAKGISADSPEVAVKVVRPGHSDPSILQRFERERRALAAMDHPSIARVLDAGNTATGLPYFVMELVRGKAITEFCDRHSMPLTERLKLFVQVCQGVQHAHQKGVIHCDLKPSNVLVESSVNGPRAKVIDFGIARPTLERSLGGLTSVASVGQFAGTPAYMSPEQTGTGGDIDTRSDIYSLGMLLYELLAGQPAFPFEELRQAAIDEVLRRIREQEPVRPSARLAMLVPERRAALARLRNCDSARLPGLVRGDLDWIVMRALEKDRARRYATASGLAADVERHLRFEPVVAGPPTWSYRFSRLVRRNRPTVIAVASIAVALVVGTVVSATQAARARRAEAEQFHLRVLAEAAGKISRAEAAKRQQVARFLQDMLGAVGPSVALGRDTRLLREILDTTAQRVDRDFKEQPEVEAELRSVIGNVYDDLGEYTKAEVMLRSALDLRKSALGPKHPTVADSLVDLGSVLQHRRLAPAAEAEFRRALELRREILGADHTNVAAALNNVGAALFQQGKFNDAGRLHHEALAIQERHVGRESTSAATTLHNLANVLIATGDYAEAEKVLRQVEGIRRKAYGDPHPLLATTLGNLGSVLWYAGKREEAESKYLATLEMQRNLLGSEHPDLATSLHNLACIQLERGRLPDSEASFRDALAMRIKLLGADHADVASTLSAQASALLTLCRFQEAESSQRKALDIQRKVVGGTHPDVGVSLNNLGDILRARGEYPQAETALAQALEILKKAVGERHQLVAIVLATQANVYRDSGRIDLALELHREVLRLREETLGRDHPDYGQSLHDLATTLLRAKKPSEAEPLLRSAIELRRRVLTPTHPDLADSLEAYSAALNALGRFPDALAAARESQKIFALALPADWHAFSSSAQVGVVLFDQEEKHTAVPPSRESTMNYREAETLLREAMEGFHGVEQQIPAANRARMSEVSEKLALLYEKTGRPDEARKWKTKP
jgi:tetratricopeptide (TPR) repeat protein